MLFIRGSKTENASVYDEFMFLYMHGFIDIHIRIEIH